MIINIYFQQRRQYHLPRRAVFVVRVQIFDFGWLLCNRVRCVLSLDC